MGASKKSPELNAHGIAGLTPLAEGHLAELAELSDIAMEMARGLGDCAEGKSSDSDERLFVSKRGIIDDFARIARVVRQIITLEQEIAGLRPLPKRRGSANDNKDWRAHFDWDNVDPFKGYRWPAERNDEHDADDLHHYDPVTFNAVTSELRKELGVPPKAPSSAITLGHDDTGRDQPRHDPNGPYAIAMAILARSKARQGHDPP